MCGIAGIINFNNKTPQISVLKNMTDVISHRGPDDEGHWHGGPIGLGHRRLSIIDLSKKAHQPMLNEDKTIVITYNGEIYNYKKLQKIILDMGVRLFSNSDTEVILRLYELFGTKAVNYLEGMFAFGIWDKKKNRLFVVRDRIGIKPLYYYHDQKNFVFASEIKAILAGGFSKKRINANALMQYMRLLVVPQPYSIFEDIHKLDPGNFLIIYPGGDIKKQCYWDVKKHITKPDDIQMDANSYIDNLRRLLEESVSSHMIADVPVGAFLSGGLDSSAVVANMRHFSKNHPISTFSTIFPGRPEYDESKYIYQVSDLFQTNHTSHEIKQDISNDFKKIAWHCDEPFGVTSSFALYYLAKVASKKLKVVLTGDGADELFAGYDGYNKQAYLRNQGGLPFTLFNALYPPILLLYQKLGMDNRFIRKIVRGFAKRAGTEGLRYSEQTSQNSLEAITKIFSKKYLGTLLENWQKNRIAEYYDSIATNDRLVKKLYSSYKTRLIDEMMMKVDRMTMAHSLEARPPILDHKIIEFAFNVPSKLKIFTDSTKKIGKYILKKAAEDKLPTNIIYRKKHPYNIPLIQLSNTNFKNDMKEKVLTGVLSANKIISKKSSEALFSELDNDQKYNNMLILLYSFETWFDVYQEKFGTINIA